jgi:hypothetical protein
MRGREDLPCGDLWPLCLTLFLAASAPLASLALPLQTGAPPPLRKCAVDERLQAAFNMHTVRAGPEIKRSRCLQTASRELPLLWPTFLKSN